MLYKNKNNSAVVSATEMTNIAYLEMMNKEHSLTSGTDGYCLEGLDGKKVWNPKVIFDRVYVLLTQAEKDFLNG